MSDVCVGVLDGLLAMNGREVLKLAGLAPFGLSQLFEEPDLPERSPGSAVGGGAARCRTCSFGIPDWAAPEFTHSGLVGEFVVDPGAPRYWGVTGMRWEDGRLNVGWLQFGDASLAPVISSRPVSEWGLADELAHHCGLLLDRDGRWLVPRYISAILLREGLV